MLPRASICLLSIVFAASGCATTPQARAVSLLGGAALAVGGVLVVQSGAVDADHNGKNEFILDDNLGAYAAGSLMVVAGAAAVLGALVSHEPAEPAPVVYARTPAPTVWATPSMPEASVMVPDVAPSITVERVPVVPLPELPATESVLRLAKQVRSAASHGRCDAAWIMWMDLEKLDRVYARGLRDSRVMANCAQ